MVRVTGLGQMVIQVYKSVFNTPTSGISGTEKFGLDGAGFGEFGNIFCFWPYT